MTTRALALRWVRVFRFPPRLFRPATRLIYAILALVLASFALAQEPAAPRPQSSPVPSPDAMPRWEKDAVPANWDWIQLTTSEWLKGHVLGLYDRKLEFDSDKFNRVTFEWNDVYQLRTAEPMEIGLVSGAIAVGRLVMIGNGVKVVGDGSIDVPRVGIQTITPWGGKSYSLRRWTGKIDLGATLQRGNTDQFDANSKANVKYRTARDRVSFDAIANFSQSQGADVANNARFNSDWDHFLKNRWFVRPIGFELFRDQFQNIDTRVTAGIGGGYQIIDTKRTEWQASGGVGYQNTRFVDVEAGEPQSSNTAAFGGATHFKREISKAVDFTCDYNFQLTKKSSGRYNHHMIAAVETDLIKALSFDVTFVWDRTQMPQPGADGVVPKKDDLRVVVALGIEF